MNILRGIVTVIYVINCLVLIVICLMQSKEDSGASSTIVGGSSSFYEKNKGRTKEGRLKKWTIILGVTFAILSIVLGTLYML